MAKALKQSAASRGSQWREEGWPKGMFRRGDSATYFWERESKGQRYKISLGSSRDRAVAWDLSKKSLASHQNRIRLLCRYLEEEHAAVIGVHQLTPEIAAGLVAWRRRQKTSRSGTARDPEKLRPPASQTIKDDIRRLRTLFKYAAEQGRIEKSPLERVHVNTKSSEQKMLDRPLSDAQVAKILVAAERYDAAPQRPNAPSTVRGMMRDVIAFYLLTGLRKDELVHLPWEHVDRDWGEFGRIIIQPLDIRAKVRLDIPEDYVEALDALVAEQGSSERLFRDERTVRRTLPAKMVKMYGKDLLRVPPRAWNLETGRLNLFTRIEWRQKATQGSVPLSKASRAIVDARWKQCGEWSSFVFPHPHGGPLKTDLLIHFKRILAVAKLPASIRIHDLRHTFAFTVRDKGVPIETIAGLMRHKDIKETMIYAPYRLEEGARRIQVLGEAWRV